MCPDDTAVPAHDSPAAVHSPGWSFQHFLDGAVSPGRIGVGVSELVEVIYPRAGTFNVCGRAARGGHAGPPGAVGCALAARARASPHTCVHVIVCSKIEFILRIARGVRAGLGLVCACPHRAAPSELPPHHIAHRSPHIKSTSGTMVATRISLDSLTRQSLPHS